MITHMHIENFKCFKDFDIDLGPFNVLIGPNDSGKTAFLQAVQLLRAHPGSGGTGFSNLYVGSGEPLETFWRRKPANRFLIWAETDHPAVRGGIKRVVTATNDTNLRYGFWDGPDNWVNESEETVAWYSSNLAAVHYYRLDPAELRAPSVLDAPFEWSGKGLPILLDRLLIKDRQHFFALEKEFYRRFPHYERLELDRIKVSGNNGLAIAFVTRQNVRVSTIAVSDGVMLSLAYLAICHQVDQPRILLVEEPENGVHHSSLKETVATLEDLSKKGVQVILTTHSPYLLDEVEPEEVRVFSKDEEGAVHAVKLSDHPEVERMRKDFMTGEIWTGLNDEGSIVSEVREGAAK